jgi:hypothetical protein
LEDNRILGLDSGRGGGLDRDDLGPGPGKLRGPGHGHQRRTLRGIARAGQTKRSTWIMKKQFRNAECGLRIAALALCALAFGTGGCATLLPGNDPVVVHAEQTTQIALDTFNAIEKTEYATYPTLKEMAPAAAIEVRTFVNSLRRHEHDWLLTARNLTKAYKSNRTPENKASLYTALAVLQAAIDESNKYIAQIQSKTS